MKAITKHKYGGPEVLKFEDISQPVPKDDEILVKVMANSVNPADWHVMRGEPKFARLSFGLFKPKVRVLGADFSGIVEAVGVKVLQFKKGDRIYGESLRSGVFAEYATVQAKYCAKIADSVSFEDMACVPIAGLTALQEIYEYGKVTPGEKVLINGSSGGVGHFAIQIAKVAGAEVTAVCSARNADFVKSLGADHVIAYDLEDIHEHSCYYDLVIDNNGNLFHSDYKRMGERGVMVGFTNLGHMMKLMLKKLFNRFPLKTFTAHANTKDLEKLAAMIASGEIKVHIEKTYPAEKTAKAVEYIEAMRTRGKVSITWT